MPVQNRGGGIIEYSQYFTLSTLWNNVNIQLFNGYCSSYFDIKKQNWHGNTWISTVVRDYSNYSFILYSFIPICSQWLGGYTRLGNILPYINFAPFLKKIGWETKKCFCISMAIIRCFWFLTAHQIQDQKPGFVMSCRFAIHKFEVSLKKIGRETKQKIML